MRPLLRRLAPLGLAALTALAAISSFGCASRRVVRSFDGELVEGRAIDARAYAAYARGAVAESDGDLEGALAAYLAAAELDREGPEPWSAAAKIACRLGRTEQAERALRRALDADPRAARAHEARARCALSRGDADEALRAASELLAADPESDATHLLRAEALARAGQGEAALAVLVDLRLRRPHRREVALALAELAVALDAPWAMRLAVQSPREHTDAPVQHAPIAQRSARALQAEPELQQALHAGDRRRALALAAAARASVGHVALGLVRHGHTAAAAELAATALEADPQDADAAAALLLAHAHRGDAEALVELGQRLAGRRFLAPNDEARRLLAQLARAWTDEPEAD